MGRVFIKDVLICVVVLFLFTGCVPSFNVSTADPGLKVVKDKEGFHISGKTTLGGFTGLSIGFPVQIPLNKKFSVSALITLKSGLTPSSNTVIILSTDKMQNFSFGLRGTKVYGAAIEKGPGAMEAFFDSVNSKPFFGDEGINSHEIKIDYDPQAQICRSYVDKVLFGQLDIKNVLKNSTSFGKIILHYNTERKDLEVNAVFKDFKIK